MLRQRGGDADQSSEREESHCGVVAVGRVFIVSVVSPLETEFRLGRSPFAVRLLQRHRLAPLGDLDPLLFLLLRPRWYH